MWSISRPSASSQSALQAALALHSGSRKTSRRSSLARRSIGNPLSDETGPAERGADLHQHRLGAFERQHVAHARHDDDAAFARGFGVRRPDQSSVADAAALRAGLVGKTDVGRQAGLDAVSAGRHARHHLEQVGGRLRRHQPAIRQQGQQLAIGVEAAGVESAGVVGVVRGVERGQAELLDQMIIQSDNMATDMLIDLVGAAEVNALMATLVPDGFRR
ncbi:MAG: hypothetical protein EOP73_15795, partial [Variovorax sp.]